MSRVAIVLFIILGSFSVAFAQSGLKLSGKLRILEPMELKVTSLSGETILSTQVERDGVFDLGPKEIVPDLYILWLGKTQQPVYLTNTNVTIKGYYDATRPENSSLSFTGIDDFLELSKWIPTEKNSRKRTINPDVRGKLKGSMYSALAYLSDMEALEPNKLLLDEIPEEFYDVLSVRWLNQKVDSLAKFAVGAEAYNFTYVDPEGKEVSLSDFRGKFVLVDFWASWCGPCRQEMKSLLPIYNELKGNDLVFISISLDKREKDWHQMLEVENLPWVMLWNKEGFTIGDAPNMIQKAYGFYSIPFIVLIDKEGRILARGLRGEKVKEEILKVRRK